MPRATDAGQMGRLQGKGTVSLLTYIQPREPKILNRTARTVIGLGFNAKPYALATKVEHVCSQRNL